MSQSQPRLEPAWAHQFLHNEAEQDLHQRPQICLKFASFSRQGGKKRSTPSSVSSSAGAFENSQRAQSEILGSLDSASLDLLYCSSSAVLTFCFNSCEQSTSTLGPISCCNIAPKSQYSAKSKLLAPERNPGGFILNTQLKRKRTPTVSSAVTRTRRGSP